MSMAKAAPQDVNALAARSDLQAGDAGRRGPAVSDAVDRHRETDESCCSTALTRCSEFSALVRIRR
jgi:hypothetical protein